MRTSLFLLPLAAYAINLEAQLNADLATLTTANDGFEVVVAGVDAPSTETTFTAEELSAHILEASGSGSNIPKAATSTGCGCPCANACGSCSFDQDWANQFPGVDFSCWPFDRPFGGKSSGIIGSGASATEFDSINKSTVTVSLGAGQKALLTDATIRTTGVTRINVTYNDGGSGDCQLYAGLQYYNTDTDKDKLFWLAPLNKCLKKSGEDSYDLIWLGRGGLWEKYDWSGPLFSGTRTYDSQAAISVKPADAVKDSYMTSGQLVFQNYGSGSKCLGITITGIEWMDFGLLDEYTYPNPSSTAPIYKTDQPVPIPTTLIATPVTETPSTSIGTFNSGFV